MQDPQQKKEDLCGSSFSFILPVGRADLTVIPYCWVSEASTAKSTNCRRTGCELPRIKPFHNGQNIKLIHPTKKDRATKDAVSLTGRKSAHNTRTLGCGRLHFDMNKLKRRFAEKASALNF